MKSLLLLHSKVLDDLGTLLCVNTSRDSKTVAARVEHEGISFLTITLPAFAKDFERSLELGYVDHVVFRSFGFDKGLPKFLGGFLDHVFNRGDGLILDNPDESAVFAIRQACLMFGKLKLECSQERIDAAFSSFVLCEKDVRTSDIRFSDLKGQFTRISRTVFGEMFTRVNQRLYEGDYRPKHGSGSTAERLLGNKKYNQREWTIRLEEVFPYMENLFTSYSHALSSTTWNEDVGGRADQLSELLEPENERPVRVITVPKTLKTPRIIAIEPTCMQYMQQAILELLTEEVERDRLLKPLVSNKYQEPNQLLALEGSRTGNLATLDLSEASDRVSNLHVQALLQNHGLLAKAVDATRSRTADVRGHGIIPLSKFASMGSALCFPFESYVFLVAILMGIENELMRPLTKKDIYALHGQVRLYGDDIIVPKVYTQAVVDSLHSLGFKVNTNKSFWNGKFRESCGKEYFAGHDVSVTRVRRLLPAQRQHVDELVSTVSLRNQLYKAGLWKTVRHLDAVVERLVPFPAASDNSEGLTRATHLPLIEGSKWSSDLQRPLVRAAVVKHVTPVDRLDGHGALLKFFLKRGDEPSPNKDHLERAGRPNSAQIKVRWISLY